MTAYEAFEDVLDINEVLQKIKSRNDSNTPNDLDMTIMDLLLRYRNLLNVEMQRTKLEAFCDN